MLWCIEIGYDDDYVIDFCRYHRDSVQVYYSVCCSSCYCHHISSCVIAKLFSLYFAKIHRRADTISVFNAVATRLNCDAVINNSHPSETLKTHESASTNILYEPPYHGHCHI